MELLYFVNNRGISYYQSSEYNNAADNEYVSLSAALSAYNPIERGVLRVG